MPSGQIAAKRPFDDGRGRVFQQHVGGHELAAVRLIKARLMAGVAGRVHRLPLHPAKGETGICVEDVQTISRNGVGGVAREAHESEHSFLHIGGHVQLGQEGVAVIVDAFLPRCGRVDQPLLAQCGHPNFSITIGGNAPRLSKMVDMGMGDDDFRQIAHAHTMIHQPRLQCFPRGLKFYARVDENRFWIGEQVDVYGANGKFGR